MDYDLEETGVDTKKLRNHAHDFGILVEIYRAFRFQDTFHV
jgi:hypothetical protein